MSAAPSIVFLDFCVSVQRRPEEERRRSPEAGAAARCAVATTSAAARVRCPLTGFLSRCRYAAVVSAVKQQKQPPPPAADACPVLYGANAELQVRALLLPSFVR